jgi:hypothetical protein
MPSPQLEAGLVAQDGYVHAAVRALMLGKRAACGAGRIIQLITGPFDASDRLACPACAEFVQGTVGRGADASAG